MYNERRDRYSVTDVLLQIAFIVLFVFLLLWLFPTKNFVQNQVQLVDDSVFNQNIMTMKDAGREYFTLERLPQKEGDKEKITLGELLGKKLILPFTDEASQSCDLTNSYIEVTKVNNEWEMKINLDCPPKSDYLISIMGCYDYCQADVCIKKEEVKPTPKPIVSSKVYEYEYKLSTGGSWGPWSNWSNWSTEKQTTGTSKEEQTKTEKVFSHYESVNTSNIVRDKFISRQTFLSTQTTTNTTEYVLVSAKDETVTTGTITVGTGTYARNQFLGTNKYNSRQATSKTMEFANERISYERTSSSPYTTQTYTTTKSNTNSVDYTNVRTSYVRTSSSPTSRQTYTTTKSNTNSVDYVAVGTSYERTSSSPASRQTYTTTKSNTSTTDYVLVSTSQTRGSYIGRQEFAKTMSNTSTREYVYVTTRSEMDCSDSCKVVTIFVYNVYSRNNNYTYDLYTKSARYTYDLYAKSARYTYDLYAKSAKYTYDVYSLSETTRTEAVTTNVKNYTYDVYSRKVETKENAVYKDVTYYSYRTREYKGGTVSVKWSRSKTDSKLTSQGYKLTGNSRVVK